MKVLILGATGFIGRPMAQAFLREGHTVIGQTRSKASARELEADEITPLLAEPSDPESWIHIVKDVDCVVDAVGGSDIKSICGIILDAVVKEAKKARPQGPPLSYIYSSGAWVHGDNLTPAYGSVSDLTPCDHPIPLTSWRLPHEQKALAAKSASFAPNIVRPSIVYGRSGSLTGAWFATAKAGEVHFYGNRDARVATVHQDDLGRLFVAVAEKALVVSGIIFDGSNAYPESIAAIMQELARVADAKGPKYSDASDDLQKATTSSDLLRPMLGRTLLGWEPRKAPLAEEMKVYYHAWLANQAA